MIWFKWSLVILLGFGGFVNLAETRKHGMPRTPHNALASAIAALVNFSFVVAALILL